MMLRRVAPVVLLASACTSSPDGGGEGGSTSTSSSSGSSSSTGSGAPEVTVVNPSVHNTVLGRPTDGSIAVSVLADAPGDAVWVEYATELTADHADLVGAQKSATVTSAAGEPMVVDLVGLAPDTRYFYRLQYQPAGQPAQADNLHGFRTQRAPGSAFHFGVQGDSHPERYQNKMFHAELYARTMEQVRDRQPDLYFMLGDDFSTEAIVEDFKDANYGAGYQFHQAVEGVAPYSGSGHACRRRGAPGPRRRISSVR